MAEKIKLNRFKPLGKNPFVGTPKPVRLPTVRVPRGPTVRWSINYDLLFKDKSKERKDKK